MPTSLFLTGASGVIGTELAPLFDPSQLVLGRHRARPGGEARQVSIDITQSQLGLSDTAFRDLAEEIDTIVHAAAVTDMGVGAEGLEETNIDGVRHMIELAKAANANFHYVSTAYCSEDYGPLRPVQSEYVQSKRVAEALARESGLDWTIIKPSIVCGHSSTGETANFQGFHLFIGSIIKGRLPIIPLDPEARCDFVPSDVIAGAIRRIVDHPQYGRTYWLTCGSDAITITDMLGYGQAFADEIGLDLSKVPIMAPEEGALDRLKAGLAGLPQKLRDRFETMLELSKVMATERPFPSDLPELFGTHPLPADRQKTVLGANIRYWGRENGYEFKTGAGA